MSLIPRMRSNLSRAIVSVRLYDTVLWPVSEYIVSRCFFYAVFTFSILSRSAKLSVLTIQFLSTRMYSGEPGSGAGRGGGGGGAIREAGGAFGKMEAAREDEYFYRKQKEQIANLKSHLGQEISFHEDQIKRHEDAIRRHKEKMADADLKTQ